jgi:hypothetical protein
MGELTVGLTGLIAHDSATGSTIIEQGEARCSRVSKASTLFFLQSGKTDPNSGLEEVIALQPGWIEMRDASSPVGMAQPFGNWLCDLPPGLETRSATALASAAGSGADKILLNMRENLAISIDRDETQTAQSRQYFQCGCGKRVRLHERRLSCKLPWKDDNGHRACSPVCPHGEGAAGGAGGAGGAAIAGGAAMVVWVKAEGGGASGASGVVEADETDDDDGANDVIGMQDDDSVQFVRALVDLSGD